MMKRRLAVMMVAATMMATTLMVGAHDAPANHTPGQDKTTISFENQGNTEIKGIYMRKTGTQDWQKVSLNNKGPLDMAGSFTCKDGVDCAQHAPEVDIMVADINGNISRIDDVKLYNSDHDGNISITLTNIGNDYMVRVN